MEYLTKSQINILAQFFANMAIVWLAAAFIKPSDIASTLQYTLSGLSSLIVSLKIVKGGE